MHEHDQEIIMALAEGTLDAAAATAAEAAISVCAECSADLDLQRFALAALDEVPDAYLTATESTRLHKALKTELIGSKTPPIRAQRSFSWARWVPVAGVAAVFLAAVAFLPSMLGGSDDDSADTTIAAPTMESAETRAATETTAAAMQEMALDDEAGGANFGKDSTAVESTEAPPATDVAQATETTAAPAMTTTAGNQAAVVDVLPFLGNIEDLDRDALIEALITGRLAATELSGAAERLDPFFASCVLANTSPDAAPTLGLPVGSEPILLGIVVTPGGEELVLVAYVPDDVVATVFATQQVYFCELVEVLP